jgi:hypothetical protein
VFNCPKCEYTTEKARSFSAHVSRLHKLSARDVYIELFLNDIIPVCKCGCGEATKFTSMSCGFNSYVYGHAIRVHNNWGHNKKAQQKSQNKRREMLKHGEFEIWNKGLTKESDERVAAYGKKCSDGFTDERKEKYSKSMSKNRLNGTVPSLTGPDHPKWRGGTSEISNLCHSNNTLYNEWKYPKLKAADFKCTKCSSTDRLHVHHDKEHMAEIIHKIRDTYPDGSLDFDQKTQIVKEVKDYHIDNNTSGLVLCKLCHSDLHESMNF